MDHGDDIGQLSFGERPQNLRRLRQHQGRIEHQIYVLYRGVPDTHERQGPTSNFKSTSRPRPELVPCPHDELGARQMR